MIFRKANDFDLPAVEQLYSLTHDAEEAGLLSTGWLRDVYPTGATAREAMKRRDLFVLEDGTVQGAAIINRIQVDVYRGAPWTRQCPEDQVCVLHTLVIRPEASGKGYGRAFVDFYERYAAEHGLSELRLDTNAANRRARTLYARLGYREIGTVPTVFNGIPGVRLVLMEKHLELTQPNQEESP